MTATSQTTYGAGAIIDRCGRAPDFSRVRRMLLLEGEPDAVPLADFWFHKSVPEKVIGRPVKTMADRVEFWYRAGYDYIKLIPGINENPAGRVPAGESRENSTGRNWAEEGKGIITNWKEFEEFVWPGPEHMNFSTFDELGDLRPPGMGVIAQYGQIFTRTWRLMGLETFSLTLYDNPELVEAVWNRAGEMMLEVWRKMASYDFVDAFVFNDDIAFRTSLFVAPEILRKYHFPWLEQLAEIARSRSAPLIYHTDGVLWEVMDDIIACGVNAIHPVEALAMDIREVKERYGNKLCLIGNLCLTGPLALGTPAQVEEEVKRLLREVAPGGGFCLGSGNSIPDYVPFENYVAMNQACLKHGTYPIRV